MVKKITLKRIQELAQEAVSEYEGMSEEDILDQMKRLIKEEEKKLLLNSLGIEKDDWTSNRFRLSREGNFMKIVSKHNIDNLAKTFLERLFSDMNVEDAYSLLKLADKKSILNDCRDYYRSSFDRKIQDLMHGQGIIDAEKMFQEYLNQADPVE